jgi:predicted transcriptional regulator of viral defense system
VRTYGGDVPYSTPAVTALDVATDLDLAGGLDNATNVIIDLATEAGMNGADVAAAARWFPVTSARRVGWILTEFTSADNLEPLRQAARAEEVAPSLLHSSFPRRGHTDRVWGLVINKKVEPDT